MKQPAEKDIEAAKAYLRKRYKKLSGSVLNTLPLLPNSRKFAIFVVSNYKQIFLRNDGQS